MSFLFYLFRSNDVIQLRRKLVALYILNFTDITFTIFLINTGLFQEANGIMAAVINKNQLYGVILKVIFPLILLLWIAYRIKKASELQLYKSNFIINIGLIFYFIINIAHVSWCILYYAIK